MTRMASPAWQKQMVGLLRQGGTAMQEFAGPSSAPITFTSTLYINEHVFNRRANVYAYAHIVLRYPISRSGCYPLHQLHYLCNQLHKIPTYLEPACTDRTRWTCEVLNAFNTVSHILRAESKLGLCLLPKVFLGLILLCARLVGCDKPFGPHCDEEETVPASPVPVIKVALVEAALTGAAEEGNLSRSAVTQAAAGPVNFSLINTHQQGNLLYLGPHIQSSNQLFQGSYFPGSTLRSSTSFNLLSFLCHASSGNHKTHW